MVSTSCRVNHSVRPPCSVSFSRLVHVCVCVVCWQHPANEAGRPSGSLPGSLQPHGQVHRSCQENRLRTRSRNCGTRAPFNHFCQSFRKEICNVYKYSIHVYLHRLVQCLNISFLWKFYYQLFVIVHNFIYSKTHCIV